MLPYLRGIGRQLKRSLVAAGFLAVIGTIWFLFLPVPLAWAARLALRITLPATVDNARVSVDRVTFRYGFLQPSLRIDLDGIAVEGASGGQLARHIQHVEVQFAKRALWRRNWAPALIEVSRPILVVDLTKPGAAATAPPPPVANAGAGAGGPALRIAALRAFIPLQDNPCRFVVNEPSVEIKTPGRRGRWLFQNIDTVFSRQDDRLRFEFPIALASTRRPVVITCRMDGALQAGRIRFAVSLPRLSSEDLPSLPVFPGEGERSKFQIAFDLEGTLRLDHLRLEEVTLNVLVDNSELHVPKVKSSAIQLHRLEIRGQARDDFHIVHLDTAVLTLDSLRLDASGLDLETGPSPRINAHVVMTGPTGTDLAAYLPAGILARLPFPAEALREIGVESVRLDVSGSGRAGVVGNIGAETFAFDGRMILDLNGEKVPLAVSAKLDGADKLIHAHLSVPAVNPARLRLTALKPFVLLQGLDCPVGLEAEATASEHGEFQTASLNLNVGHGKMRAFGPLAKEFTVNSAILKADTLDAGQTIYVSDLRLDLDGPVLSLADLTAKVSPDGAVTAQGEVTVDNVGAEFLVPLGQGTVLAPLVPFGLQPKDLHIALLAGSFSATVTPMARDIWPTVTAKFDERMDLRVRDEPVGLHVIGVINGSADFVDAEVIAAEFRPARLRLKLPGGLTSAAFDFPVRFQARVVGGLRSQLRSVTGSLAVGTGVLRANPYCESELPITSLSFEASVDGSLKSAELRALRADLSGLVVRADLVKLAIDAKPVVSGALEVEGATIDRILRLWPTNLQSALRRQIADSIKTGELTRAKLRFTVPIDVAKPADTRPTELTGEIFVDGLRLETPFSPGPVSLERLAIAAKYPGAVATLTNLAAPGITLADTTVQSTDLFAPAAQLEIASGFAADLSKTTTWLRTLGVVLPPNFPVSLGKLAGTASGDLQAALPLGGSLDLGALDFRIRAQIDGPVILLTSPEAARVGGGQLAVTTTSLRGQLSSTIDWTKLEVTVPSFIATRVNLHVAASRSRSDEFEAHATLDPQPGPPALEKGTALSPLLAPLTIDARFVGSSTQPKRLAQFEATSSDFFGGPFAIAAHATFLASSGRLESVGFSPLQLGRTNLSAELDNRAEGRWALTIKGQQLDVAGSLRLAAPFVIISPPGRSAAAEARTANRSGVPPRLAELNASVAIDAVEFGSGRTVRDFSLSTRIVDDLPQELTLRGRENGTNALSLTVTPKGDHQSVMLTIADATAWLQALTQPFREVKLPANTVASMADALGEIPILLSGGRFELGGDLRLRNPAHLFDGSLKLADTVIRQPPRVLQLVALKSGKRLRENPVIKEISAGRFFVSDKLVALEGIKSDAASLAYLKLNFLRYGVANETLHLDGKYVGIGFEVMGTRSEPQVFLKDNLLIGAIGSEPEFAFAEVPVAAPPPPPPEKD